MRLRLASILAVMAVTAVVLSACDKAPKGIIKESRMAPLVADIALAEAYIDANPNSFMDDSSRMAMKQSVMMNHGTTIAEYEKSLDWYAHHLDVYNDVMEDAIAIIDKKTEEQNKILGDNMAQTFDQQNAKPGQGGSRRFFPAKGDTANIWTLTRTWMLTSSMHRGFIPFEINNPPENRQGDRYNLNFKLIGSGNHFNVFLAVDYNDGTTSYMHRGAAVEGWGDYLLQSDSKRIVRRVYGYIGYNIQGSSIAFIDSIQLVRTRYDASNYSLFNMQRAVGFTPGESVTTRRSPLELKQNKSSDRR